MLADTFRETLQRIEIASVSPGKHTPRLLAVSKTHPIEAITALAACGQRAFGENYVQEAAPKIAALDGRGLEWHLIGHLQSNKADVAARLFDWVQTVDRPKLVTALARHRDAGQSPLNLLIQVNVDDEAGKQGCPPGEIDTLASLIEAEPRLVLRGLMAIPTPHADIEQRRPAFRQMRALFDALVSRHPSVDTLSMGMSDDFVLAIEEGTTMVRMGTALFGTRPPKASGDTA